MRVAKKKNSPKTNGDKNPSKEELREKFTNMGPLRLRKYAIAGLNISADIVDNWNDFNYMVDYCVAKAMGEEAPEESESNGEEAYSEDSGEFDASNVDGEEEDFDSEMEGGGESMFADQSDDDDAEEEQEEEKAPPKEKPKSTKKSTPKGTKKATSVPVNASGDSDAQFQALLDVITNQGAVLDKMSKTLSTQKSTIEEIYVRQEATHRALTGVAKTVWQISTYVAEFVPRALKAMRFKPQVNKSVKDKAEAAAKIAEEAIARLLDPEAD